MINFFNRLLFWFNNSRPYTIPITFLSWLVIFVYSAKSGGDIFCGIISYFGIALVHLVTNLADDYFDYNRMQNDPKYLSESKDSKCRYLKQGNASLDELRLVILGMLFVSAVIGAFLFF